MKTELSDAIASGNTLAELRAAMKNSQLTVDGLNQGAAGATYSGLANVPFPPPFGGFGR